MVSGGRDYQDSLNRQARINTACPSCGRQTIIIGAGRLLVCAFLGCRDPHAINEAIDTARELAASRDRERALVSALKAMLEGRPVLWGDHVVNGITDFPIEESALYAADEAIAHAEANKHGPR